MSLPGEIISAFIYSFCYSSLFLRLMTAISLSASVRNGINLSSPAFLGVGVGESRICLAPFFTRNKCSLIDITPCEREPFNDVYSSRNSISLIASGRILYFLSSWYYIIFYSLFLLKKSYIYIYILKKKL